MQAPIPLLGLPREIRDSIYGFTFDDFPLPRKVACWPYPDCLHGAPNVPPVYDTTKNITNTSLLRTSRQVRAEAYVVMLKKHQLVLFTLTNVLLSPHLIGAMLYIAPLSDRALASYPGFIMTHRIEGEQDEDSGSPPRAWSFALPWRDLPMFCRAASGGHLFSPDATAEIRHRVTMHDPFAATSSPGYMCPRNQGRYLQPYLDWLAGGVGPRHLDVAGGVDGHLAASLRAEMIQKLPAPDVNKMLNRHTRPDATGRRHLLPGRGLARFARACLRALAGVSARLADTTDAWLEPGPGGRPNAHVRGVGDIFDVLSREHGDARWGDAGAGGAQEDHTWHLSRAIQAAASLLAGRAPSAAQRSGGYLLNARAHRLFSGCPAAAEAALGLALDVVAGGEAFDGWREQCLEEAHEIARWKGVRNGRA